MMTSHSPFADADFRRWFAAETLLTVSMSTELALSLMLIDVSGSIALSGALASAISAVTLVCGVVGGGLADARNRRRIIRRCLWASILSMVTLLAALLAHHMGAPIATGALTFLIVASAAVVAGAEALADPSMDAALKELIEPAQYPRAMSAAQARTSLVSLGGAPATGALYGVSPFLPFVLRLLCDGSFLVLLKGIRRTFEPPRTGRGRLPLSVRSFLASYREGLGWVFSDSVVRTVVVCAPLVNLMVFTAGSWVVYSMSARDASPSLIGLVSMSFAVGTLIGSAFTPWLTDNVPSGRLAIAGLSWMALTLLAIFLFGVDPVVLSVLSCACMLPSPSIGAGLFAHVFRRTPSELQGRTLGVFTLMNGIATVSSPAIAAVAVACDGSLVLGVAVTALGVLGILALVLSRSVRGLAPLKEVGPE